MALSKLAVEAPIAGESHFAFRFSYSLFEMLSDQVAACARRAIVVAGALLMSGTLCPAQNDNRPEPTRKDVPYGPHERNVLDFWQADSEQPAPLVIYIHGGGFRAGSKDGINAGTLRQLLQAGISVAALNYRLVQQAPLPAAHHDCRRALQLLRAKAEEWNIDKSRVGAFGGSAGAQLCMYLAFHDDMADPEDEDAIARESTRLACVATSGGQTTMNQQWWVEHIPGYESPHRDFYETFGVTTQEEYLERVAEVSALSLISKDDPPIFMSYGMSPDAEIPSDTQRVQGWKVHHVAFGVALKEKMEELGVEADLKYPGAETTYASNVEFFVAKLAKGAASQPSADSQPQRGARLVPSPESRGPAEFLRRVKAGDKDGDGKISRREAPPGMSRLFDRLDADGDGTLDDAELKAAAARLRGGQRSPTRRPQGVRPQAVVPEGVELITDIAYREGNEKWRLDLAMPKQRAEALRPALVIVHGGGWRSGDKGGGQWRQLPLEYAAKGYVCISVNYRLTDEAPFPACVEDVKCAVRWLRAHAEQYQVDPARIGGYGNSAGAHLVAMLGLVGPDAQLEGDGPYQDQSSLVQAVCCSATPTDFTNWSGRPGRGPGSRAGGGLLAGPEETLSQRAAKASPISYVHADAPPFLVIHGTDDPTVPIGQGDRFVEALKDAGAKEVTYLRFEGANHGVFGQHSDETHPAMEKFFARTIGRAAQQ